MLHMHVQHPRRFRNFEITLKLFTIKNLSLLIQRKERTGIMSQISVNFREVENQVRELRTRLNVNLLPQVNQEYRQIKASLSSMDGAAAAEYINALDENNEKVAEACNVLNKLLSFIANSSREIEKFDIAISRNFTVIRK